MACLRMIMFLNKLDILINPIQTISILMEVSQSNVLIVDNNTNQTKGSYRNLKPPDQYVISYNFQHANSISFTHNLLIGMGLDQTRKITNKNKSFASLQSQKNKTLAKGSQWKQPRPNTQSVAQVYQSKVVPKRYIPPVSPKISQVYAKSNFNEAQATQNTGQNIHKRDNHKSITSQHQYDNYQINVNEKNNENKMVSPYQQKLSRKLQKIKMIENKVLEDEREEQQKDSETEQSEKIIVPNQQNLDLLKDYKLLKKQNQSELSQEEQLQPKYEKTLKKEEPQFIIALQDQNGMKTVFKQNQSQNSIASRLSTKIPKPQSELMNNLSKKQIQQDQLRLLQQQVRRQEGDKIRKNTFKTSFNHQKRQIFPFQANIEQFFATQVNKKKTQDKKNIKQVNNSTIAFKKQSHNGINHSTTQLNMKRNSKPNTANEKVNQNQKIEEVKDKMNKQLITADNKIKENQEGNQAQAMKRIASSNLNSLVANRANSKLKNGTQILPIPQPNKNRSSINNNNNSINNKRAQNGSNQVGEVDLIEQKHQIKGVKIPQNIIKATSRNNQQNLNTDQRLNRLKTAQNTANSNGNNKDKTGAKYTTILGTSQNRKDQQLGQLPSKKTKNQNQKLKYSSSVDNINKMRNNQKMVPTVQPLKETTPRTAKSKQRNFKKWKQTEIKNNQKESRSLKTRSDYKSKSQSENISKQKLQSKGSNKDKKMKKINQNTQEEDKFGLFSENKRVKGGREKTNNKQNKKYNNSNDSKDFDQLCPDIVEQSENEGKIKESQDQIDASPDEQFRDCKLTGEKQYMGKQKKMKSHLRNQQLQHQHLNQQQIQGNQQEIQQKDRHNELNILIEKERNNNQGEILQDQPSLDHISRIGSSRCQDIEPEIPFQVNQNSQNNSNPLYVCQPNQIENVTHRQDLQTLLQAANEDNSRHHASSTNRPKDQKTVQLIKPFGQQNGNIDNGALTNCNQGQAALVNSQLNHKNESMRLTQTKQIKQYKFNETNSIGQGEDVRNLSKNAGNRSDDFFQHNIPQMSKGNQSFNRTFNLTKYENFDKDVNHYNRAPVLSFLYEILDQTIQCRQKFRPSNKKLAFLHKLEETPQVGASLINQAVNILLSIDSWILERIFEPYYDEDGKIGVWLYCHGIWKLFIENTAVNYRTVIANAIEKAIDSLNCGRELQKILRMLSGVRVMKLRSNKKKVFNELQYSMKKGHVLRAATAKGSKWGERLFEVVKVQVSKNGDNVLQIRENNERVWIKQSKFKQIFQHFLLICTRQSHFWTTRQLKCLPSHKAVLEVSSLVPAHGSITLFYPSVAPSSLLLYKQLQSKVLRYLGKIDSKQNQNGNLYFQFRLQGTYCLFLETPTDCGIAIESTTKLEIGCLEYIKSETLRNEQCEYIELNRSKGEKRQSGDNLRADQTLERLRQKFIRLVVKK